MRALHRLLKLTLPLLVLGLTILNTAAPALAFTESSVSIDWNSLTMSYSDGSNFAGFDSVDSYASVSLMNFPAGETGDDSESGSSTTIDYIDAVASINDAMGSAAVDYTTTFAQTGEGEATAWSYLSVSTTFTATTTGALTMSFDYSMYINGSYDYATDATALAQVYAALNYEDTADYLLDDLTGEMEKTGTITLTIDVVEGQTYTLWIEATSQTSFTPVPEPASFALLGLGLLGLGGVIRRRAA